MSQQANDNKQDKAEYVKIPSPVVKKLIAGKNGDFISFVNSELQVRSTKNDGKGLTITIRGAEISTTASKELYEEFCTTANSFAEENKIEKLRDIKDGHYVSLKKILDNLVEKAKDSIKLQSSIKSAADRAAKETARQLAPHLKKPANNGQATSKKIKSSSNDHIVKFIEDTFSPRNKNQAIAWLAMKDTHVSLVFLAGKAGGGKTYPAIRAGLESYNQDRVSRIRIIRPRTVTASRDFGAVGGNPRAKMDPYLKAINSNIEKITGEPLSYWENKKIVLAETPDFDRGETFDNEFIIIDEPQNMSPAEAEMLITRIGENSTMVFAGDIGGHQNDLGAQIPGLAHLIATIGYGAQNDPKMKIASAFIQYSSEDSAARSNILPHINKALGELDPAYKAALDAVASARRDFKLTHALETLREQAQKMLDQQAQRTHDQYASEASKKYSTLFTEKTVVPLRGNQPASRKS